MLKRVEVSQLRTGMYVHELCGSWMDHPFWRSSFPLNSPKQLRQLRESNVSAAWIDTGRGLDVEGGESVDQVEQQVAKTLRETPPPTVQTARTSMEEELQAAAKLCARAKPAVISMFNEARMGRAIDAESALPLVEEISSSVMRNPGALISLARLKERDDYTYMHSVAVCALMVALARQLGMNEDDTREAGLGGLVHDLGKSAIALEILNKPGKLTDEEFMAIKSHPEIGHRLLLNGRGAGDVPLDICLHHHEKIDGSGYPHRLPGERISQFAKMGAVCDVYDAITSDRPYKAGWDPSKSLQKMAEWSNNHFDLHVFQAFVKSLGIYPIGSLVRLQSDLLGVVIDQNEGTLLLPKVRVFYCSKRRQAITPRVIDLAHTGDTEKIISRENAADWRLGDISHHWAIPATTAVHALAR